MANKYKQRRRQLRQTQAEGGNPYDSGYAADSKRYGDDWNGASNGPNFTGHMSAAVAQPALGLVKYFIAFSLLIAVWMVYAQTARHDFTVCDDNVYIYENPAIEQGLTRPLGGPDGIFGGKSLLTWIRWDAIIWAFSDSHAGNWHPLTWLTHMLDWQMYGEWRSSEQRYVNSWPGGHHMTNMIIHALNSIILFFALRKMTGTQWASAAVAMLFALHPLRAESVAWSAERKDVLCGFFWMLTLWCYAYYARQPSILSSIRRLTAANSLSNPDFAHQGMIVRSIIRAILWYLAVSFMLFCGLMSKSMIVTLPCVLFLLDLWPLNRVTGKLFPEEGEASSLLQIGWLALEKLPWLAIVMGVSYITILGQNKGVALNSFEALPMWMRLVNMSLAYVAYISQSLWPTNMAPFYTHLGMIPSGELRHSMTLEVIASACLAAVFLFFITCVVVALAFVRRCGWAAVGWFWFLGAAVPVIGILQVGTQSRADRYTYLPTIGLAIMLVWAIRWAVEWLPALRPALTGCVALAVGVLMSLAWLQVSYWKTSYTLFEHAVQVTDRNFFGFNHLGIAFDKDSKDGSYTLTPKHRAEFDHFGIPYDKNNADPRLPLNIDQRHALADLSAKNFAETIRIKPDYDFGNNNLGVYYANKNDIVNAEKYFLQALRCNNRYADVYNNLGVLYRIQADRCQEKALTADASAKQKLMAEANANLAKSLEAHTRGLQVRQDKASDYNNIAQTLHELGRDNEAISELNTSLAIDPSFIASYLTMGEIFLKNNRVRDADQCLKKALQIDPNSVVGWCQWALAALNKGDPALAKAAALEVIKIAPKLPIAYELLGEVAGRTKNYDEAIAACRKVIELDPKSAPAHLHSIAVLQNEKGDLDAAIQTLRDSLKIDPNYLPTHLLLAQYLTNKGQVDEAILHFKSVLQGDRTNVNVWYLLGQTLLHKGDMQNAMNVAQQLQGGAPNFSGGYSLMGQVDSGANKLDEAIAQYQKAISLEPGNVLCYDLLSTALWQKGNRSAAIQAMEKAVQLDPKNAALAAKLAKMRQEAGP